MKKIIFIITTFTLFSCEKDTHVDYYIKNNLSSYVTLEGKNIIHSNTINDTIYPGENIHVISWRKWGKETEPFDPTSAFGHDMLIINIDGDTLIKDYTNLSNWNTEITNNTGSAIHKYTLYVNNEDF